MFIFENDEITVKDTVITVESIAYYKDDEIDEFEILQLYPPIKWDLKINVKDKYLFCAYCSEFDVFVETWDFDEMLENIKQFIIDMYENEVLSSSPSDPELAQKLIDRIVPLNHFT